VADALDIIVASSLASFVDGRYQMLEPVRQYAADNSTAPNGSQNINDSSTGPCDGPRWLPPASSASPPGGRPSFSASTPTSRPPSMSLSMEG
jgi:hypothetical protein